MKQISNKARQELRLGLSVRQKVKRKKHYWVLLMGAKNRAGSMIPTAWM